MDEIAGGSIARKCEIRFLKDGVSRKSRGFERL